MYIFVEQKKCWSFFQAQTLTYKKGIQIKILKFLNKVLKQKSNSLSLVPVEWAETLKNINGHHNSWLQWCTDLKLKSNIASSV